MLVFGSPSAPWPCAPAVTDGEIPQPSEAILSRLAAAQQSLGLEVHGLLVGRNVTPAMEALCSHLHVFRSWSVVVPGAGVQQAAQA